MPPKLPSSEPSFPPYIAKMKYAIAGIVALASGTASSPVAQRLPNCKLPSLHHTCGNSNAHRKHDSCHIILFQLILTPISSPPPATHPRYRQPQTHFHLPTILPARPRAPLQSLHQAKLLPNRHFGYMEDGYFHSNRDNRPLCEETRRPNLVAYLQNPHSRGRNGFRDVERDHIYLCSSDCVDPDVYW